MPATNYETVFITEPEIANEQVDQIVGKLKQTIEAHQGSVTNEDRWGRRRLAYPIQSHREGVYVVLQFTAEPTIVAAMDHYFNVTDTVIRHLTIRRIKRNKTFPPRRERPAATAEGSRPYQGRSGASRPRTEPMKTNEPAAPAATVTEAPAEKSGEQKPS